MAKSNIVGRKPTAERIVAEIVQALTYPIEDYGNVITKGALDEWKAKLLDAIKTAIKNGSDWNEDGGRVLRVARDMGRIAIILCGDDDQVTKNIVNAAFKACKSHTVCPGKGHGAWCEF